MSSVADWIGQTPGLHTRAGCGWTGDNGWPAPCAVPLNPPGKVPTILGVSVWDAFAADLDGYAAAHDYYDDFGPVVWVGAPEVESTWTAAEVAALNAGVAETLGCALAPWEIRHAEYVEDNLHYTDKGRATVAARRERGRARGQGTRAAPRSRGPRRDQRGAARRRGQ